MFLGCKILLLVMAEQEIVDWSLWIDKGQHKGLLDPYEARVQGLGIQGRLVRINPVYEDWNRLVRYFPDEQYYF